MTDRARTAELTTTSPAARGKRPTSRDNSHDLFGRRAVQWWPDALTTAAISFAFATVALRLWHTRLSLPYVGAGDTLTNLMVIRNIQITGWFQSTPELGAPFGQHLAGYPAFVGDTFQFLILRVMASFWSPAVVLNVYYLMWFPITAVTSLLVMRRLGVRRDLAVACAALYALLPYHLARFESHLFLANYATVPVACLLIVRLMSGEGTFTRDTPRRRRYATYATCALLAGFGLYYTVFTLVGLAAGGVLRFAQDRTFATLRTTAKMALSMVAMLLLSAIPYIAFKHSHPGQSATVRDYFGVEVYSLKLVTMLLPQANHWLHPFAELRQGILASPVPGERSEALGLLGSVGLLLLFWTILRAKSPANSPERVTIRHLSLLTMVLFLFSTVGGFGSILAAAGMDMLRGLNRSSVFIGFCSFTAIALAIGLVLQRFPRLGRNKVAFTPLLVVGFLLAFVDQTNPSPTLVSEYRYYQTQWQQDQDYFQKLQQIYGLRAPIYQLPYVPFPENPPVVNMGDYQHLRGYLHSDLTWSYGALKLPEDQWQARLSQRPVPEMVDTLAKIGFVAIYLDRDGFTDDGVTVERQIRETLGLDLQATVDTSSRLLTYDLRPYRNAHGYTTRLTPEAVKGL